MNTTLEVFEMDGELYLELPNNFIKELGWSEGDTLVWTENDDGSYTLRKEEAV
jgi:hypothetical protein